jgi:hypothetical protein
MYSGTLIDDLFAMAERARVGRTNRERANREQANGERPPSDLRSTGADPQVDACHCRTSSEPEQFTQPPGLSPADWNLSLLLIVHAQLIRALEPRDDFADAVDVHQVGAVRPPKKIRI